MKNILPYVPLAQLLITVLIAGIATLIAYRQWQTAHQRVVLDLFERRMAIYEAARAVIGDIMREGRASGTEFFGYVQATDRLSLLFGDEVVNYSNVVRERINQLALDTSMIDAFNRGDPVSNYHHHVDRQADAILALSKFYEEFPSLIMPYVRMDQKLKGESFKGRLGRFGRR